MFFFFIGHKAHAGRWSRVMVIILGGVLDSGWPVRSVIPQTDISSIATSKKAGRG